MSKAKDYLIVVTQPATGALGYWTGTNWDTDAQKALRAHTQESLKPLLRERKKTLPAGWRVSIQVAPGDPQGRGKSEFSPGAKIGDVKKNPRRKKNPIPPSQHAKVKEAIERFKDFTGMDPQHVDEYFVNNPDVGFVVGSLDGVLYSTVREGKAESYVHKFKKKSRPLLCSSHDGKTLIILGGEYDFTDRGIVDKE